MIHALGQRLHALEPIARIGEFLGYSRSSGYRCAERDGWPLVDTGTGRGRVSVAALLERYGIPYTVEEGTPMSDEPTAAERAWIVEQRDLMVEKAQAANAIALPKQPKPDADDDGERTPSER